MGEPFKGSEILRKWKRERDLARALTTRTTRGLRRSGAGFAGAAIDRLTASLATWSGSVNADLDATLGILRARSRALAANNEHGRRFVNLVAANVVGQGPKLQVRATMQTGELDKAANDALEIHFAKWARTAELTGRMDLAHCLRVAIKAVARDGEAIVRKVRNRGFPYGLKLQLLEADRLDETINTRLDNGNTIRQGVELDAYLRPIAYHIKTAHPGDTFQTEARVERVPARDVFHLFLPERAEQVRGIPWMHAVLKRAAMLDAYEEAAVVAARVGAAKMGVFTKKEDAPDSTEQLADREEADGSLTMSAEAGEFIEAPPGYTLEAWDPDYPHANFEAFLKTCLRGVASGLDVAAHNLTGDMTDVNYSSARIAELAERDTWRMLQDWLEASLLVPVYQEWLATALLMGQVTFPKTGKALPAERIDKFLDASRFQARTWPWVDPSKDVEASARLIDLGLASRTEIAASQGKEIEDVLDELAQETAYAKTKGITLGAAPNPTTAPTTPPEEQPK